jgi:hypothetical protein
MKVVLTSHAIEQYISRTDRSKSYTRAERELDAASRVGTLLDKRSRTGERYLALERLGVHLIIKRDGTENIAVTCVPGKLPEDDGDAEDEELPHLYTAEDVAKVEAARKKASVTGPMNTLLDSALGAVEAMNEKDRLHMEKLMQPIDMTPIKRSNKFSFQVEVELEEAPNNWTRVAKWITKLLTSNFGVGRKVSDRVQDNMGKTQTKFINVVSFKVKGLDDE